MDSFHTTDLSDQHGDRVQVAEAFFRSYGGRTRFHGRIATVSAPEDNSLVRRALEEPGEGRVLVVDGGGSLRVALLGDRLGELAVKSGWSGVVVYGCVRDSEALAKLPLGVLALCTSPRKSHKQNRGSRDEVLQFAGVQFVPGEFLYADPDGIVLSPEALTTSAPS